MYAVCNCKHCNSAIKWSKKVCILVLILKEMYADNEYTNKDLEMYMICLGNMLFGTVAGISARIRQCIFNQWNKGAMKQITVPLIPGRDYQNYTCAGPICSWLPHNLIGWLCFLCHPLGRQKTSLWITVINKWPEKISSGDSPSTMSYSTTYYILLYNVK